MDQIAPLPLALLALAGGYCFITAFYRGVRVEGHRLFFESAVAAVILVLISRSILVGSWSLWPAEYRIARGWWHEFAPRRVPALATFAGAFFLGLVLRLNVSIPLLKKWSSKRAVRKHASEVERLLYESMNETLNVSVSLENRKVYVGVPVQTFDPRKIATHFRILPIMSGYRDETDLQVKFTTQYWDVYDLLEQAEEDRKAEWEIIQMDPVRLEEEKNRLKRIESGEEAPPLCAEDFEIVIPFEKLSSANRYSFEIGSEEFAIVKKP